MADEEDPAGEGNPSMQHEKSGSSRGSQGSSASRGRSIGNGKEVTGSTSIVEAGSREVEHATSKTSSLRSAGREVKNVSHETIRSTMRSLRDSAKSDEQFFQKDLAISKQKNGRESISFVQQLRTEEKDAKKQQLQRSKIGLNSREQRLCQRRFREMIGKRELRNAELGKRHGDLRQRLDLLECSVPAVMVWNIWQMAQNGEVCGVQRALEKHFRGAASGEAICPNRPSQHYDCRVRETEVERKQAQGKMDEARTLWTERTAMLEEKKRRLEEARRIQEERKKRIQELNEEVRQLRETFDAMELEGSCEAGECGDMECKRRLLSRVSSAGSIRSNDVECLERLQSLAEAEVSMKRQIADLERREDAYMKTLQQADEFWSKAEGDTASTLSALEKQLEMKTTANRHLAEKVCQLEDELESLRSRMTSCRAELEKFLSVEKIEALIGREDDVAAVSDKSVAARVKLKHRLAGRDDDMAGILDKDVLAKQDTVDEEVLAVIQRQMMDEETLIASDSTEVATDVQSFTEGKPTPTEVDLAHISDSRRVDLESAIRAGLLAKPEDFPQQELLLNEAKNYLEQLGSLSDLYRDDDYGVCGPQFACYEDFPSEEIISTPTITADRSEKISGEDEEKLLGITSLEKIQTYHVDEVIDQQELSEQYKHDREQDIAVDDDIDTEVETVQDLVTPESEVPKDEWKDVDRDFVTEKDSAVLVEQVLEEKSTTDQDDYDMEELFHDTVSAPIIMSSELDDEDIKDAGREKDVRIAREELLSWLDVIDSARVTIAKCPDCRVINGDVNALAQQLAKYAEVEIKTIPEGEPIQSEREIKPDVTEGKAPDPLDLPSEVEPERKTEPDVEIETKAEKVESISIETPAAVVEDATVEQRDELEMSKSVPVELTPETTRTEELPDRGTELSLAGEVEESVVGEVGEVSDESEKTPGEIPAEPSTSIVEDKKELGAVGAETTEEVARKLEDETDATQAEYIIQGEILPEDREEVPVTILRDEKPTVEESEEAALEETIDLGRPAPEKGIESFEEMRDEGEAVSMVDKISAKDDVSGIVEQEPGDQIPGTPAERSFVDREEVESVGMMKMEDDKKPDEEMETGRKEDEDKEDVERKEVESIVQEREDLEREYEQKLKEDQVAEEWIREERVEEERVEERRAEETLVEEERVEEERVEEERVEEKRVEEERVEEEEVEEEREEETREEEKERAEDEGEDEDKEDEERKGREKEKEDEEEEDKRKEDEEIEEAEKEVEEEDIKSEEDKEVSPPAEKVAKETKPVTKKDAIEIVVEYREIERIEILSMAREETREEEAGAADAALREGSDKIREVSRRKEVEVSLKTSSMRVAIATGAAATEEEKPEEKEALGEESYWELTPRAEAMEKEIKEVEVELQVTVTREEEVTEIGEEEILITKETESVKKAILITKKVADDETMSEEVMRTSLMLMDSDVSVKPYLVVADIEEEDAGIPSEKKEPCVCESGVCSELSAETAKKSETIETITKTQTVDVVSQTVSSIGTQTTLSQKVSKRSGSSRTVTATTSTGLASKVSERLTERRDRSKDQSTVTTVTAGSQTERSGLRGPQQKYEAMIPSALRTFKPTHTPGAMTEEELRSINYERAECNCCLCGLVASKTGQGRLASVRKPGGTRIDQEPRLCPRCRAKRLAQAVEAAPRVEKSSRKSAQDQEVYAGPIGEPRFLFRRKPERKDQSCMAKIRKLNRVGEVKKKEKKPDKAETMDTGKISPVSAGKRDVGRGQVVEDPDPDCICYQATETSASGLIKKLNCSCGDSD